MLEGKEIVDRLFDLAQMFRHYMRRKEYLEAALCVDWMKTAALFIGLDEDTMAELFGSRQDEERPVKGVVDEDIYLKACEWCICHGYENSRRTYQNVQRLIR